MKTKKRPTAEARKQQIIAAADLVLLDGGIEGFTVDQVIARAQIAKGTVYNHYRNKDEMLAELGIKALQLLLDRFTTATDAENYSSKKIAALCLACYDYYREFPDYFELISYMERPEFNINYATHLKISQKIQRFTNDLIVHGQSRGEIKSEISPTLTGYIIWASCMGVVQFVDSKKKLLTNHHEIDIRQLVTAYAEILTAGLKA
ncbi:MAG: TetR/AcrR family transcriptional regulator [Bacteroidota bacterium]